jgi:uncharacterized protein YcbK (DUF882 family)
MTRRGLLSGAAAALAAGPAAAYGRLFETRWSGIGQTHLWVRQPGGREEAHVRFRTADGALVAEGVRALSWVWRDWRDGDAAVWVDYRLFDVLAWIQTRVALEDDRPCAFTLTSGFRTAERNATLEGAARNSQHIHGRAADLVLDGCAPERLARLAEEAGAGGVGRYAAFTHVDVGREGRRW